MKTNIAIGIVAIAVAIIIGLFVSNTNKEPQIDVATSLEIRNEFNIGCTENGETYAVCDCMYDEIVNQIGERALLKEAFYYDQNGVFSDSMWDILPDVIIACY